MSTQGSKKFSRSDLEIKRQIFHLVAISLWIPLILYLPSPIVLVLMIFVVLTNFAVVMKKEPFVKIFWPLIEKLEREENLERPSIQALLGNIGILISFLLLGKLAVVSVVILAVGDALSTLVGRTIGKNPIFYNSKKTWEGSLAFFLGSFFALWIFLDFKVALLFSLVCAFVESLPLPVDDNLSVPLSSSLLGVLVLL